MSLPARRVRDAHDADDLLQRWQASGEPISAWCARHGVIRQSLQRWRRPEPTPIRVAEVVLPGVATYRVVLTNGRELVLEGDFDTDIVRRLLDAVDG